jgi:hypothetical protein
VVIGHIVAVALWIRYCRFMERIQLGWENGNVDHSSSSSAPAIERVKPVRNVYEDAVTAVGLDVAAARALWETYIAFEQNLYASIEVQSVVDNKYDSSALYVIVHCMHM